MTIIGVVLISGRFFTWQWLGPANSVEEIERWTAQVASGHSTPGPEGGS
jgi:hypothetical protein